MWYGEKALSTSCPWIPQTHSKTYFWFSRIEGPKNTRQMLPEPKWRPKWAIWLWLSSQILWQVMRVTTELWNSFPVVPKMQVRVRFIDCDIRQVSITFWGTIEPNINLTPSFPAPPPQCDSVPWPSAPLLPYTFVVCPANDEQLIITTFHKVWS